MNTEEEEKARETAVDDLAFILDIHLHNFYSPELREEYVSDYKQIFGIAVKFQNDRTPGNNFDNAKTRTTIKRALRMVGGGGLLVIYQHFKIDNCSTWIKD